MENVGPCAWNLRWKSDTGAGFSLNIRFSSVCIIPIILGALAFILNDVI